MIGAVLHSGLLGSTQQDRLTSFVNQDQAPKVDLSDASSAEYNLRQSKIAIGSGGWTGKGVFNGTQTRLNNVPFQHTDFIFTAVGEQLGLVGAASLLARLLDHGLADPADRRSSHATTSACSCARASWRCSSSRSSRTSG